jgi:hypothetical protein
MGGHVLHTARSLCHPVFINPANQIVVRMVPHDVAYLPDYASVLRVPPDNDGLNGGAKSGAFSTTNRVTGEIGGGHPGLNGLYFGTPMGVAAEDTFYSVWDDSNDDGPRRLMPTTSRVVVQRMKDGLNRWEDQDTPEQLIFSGRSNANIIVARTIRPVRSLNLNMRDPMVQQHLRAIEAKFKDILAALEFNSLEQAIEDPYFREFTRQFVFGAAEGTGVEAIWASSVRTEEAGGLPGFDKDEAQNLVLLGQGNQSVSDRLLGVAVISVRSSATTGLEVTAEPIHGKHSQYRSSHSCQLVVTPPASELDQPD